MILSDSAIRGAIDRGKIVIDRLNLNDLGSNSYDVRLARTLARYTARAQNVEEWGKEVVLDAKRDRPLDYFEIPSEGGYMLKPGVLYLGVTQEYTETHEHVPMLRSIEHLLVNLRRCRCNHVPDTVEIRRLERSLRDRHAGPMKFRSTFRRNDGHMSTVSQKSCEFRCGNLSAAHEKHSPTSQLQEDWIHKAACSSNFAVLTSRCVFRFDERES